MATAIAPNRRVVRRKAWRQAGSWMAVGCCRGVQAGSLCRIRCYPGVLGVGFLGGCAYFEGHDVSLYRTARLVTKAERGGAPQLFLFVVR
jgi:hypothetical protein